MSAYVVEYLVLYSRVDAYERTQLLDGNDLTQTEDGEIYGDV
jgi:hypothetical protein